jgi:hypothetical protein
LGFNFPNSPTSGDQYTPPAGPTYTWDGIAWKAVMQGVPVTVYVSDSPPPQPAIGQLWWNSASGTMAIWYADADSAQWVQVSGNVAQNAPIDGGEYVLCNGVWRLKSQTFDMVGKNSQDIIVPAWGPSKARLTTFVHTGATTGQYLRISIDGTTFPGASGDYYLAGFFNQSGVSAVSGIANVAVTAFQMTGGHNHSAIPSSADSLVELTRMNNAYAFGFKSIGGAGSDGAGIYQTIYYSGYAFPTSFPGAVPVKTLRWYMSASVNVSSGKLTVEWLA